MSLTSGRPQLSDTPAHLRSISASASATPRAGRPQTFRPQSKALTRTATSLTRQATSLVSKSSANGAVATKPDLQGWVDASKTKRAEALEAQALEALKNAVEAFERPAFPCALIAGDVVILDLLNRLDLLSGPKAIHIIFIDTFHLFDETHELLHRLEEKYGFKAKVYHAKDFADKAAYKAVHGSDLFITDIDEYDKICKVEPFSRSLKDLNVDLMVNGRRRDHGFERAHLEVFEDGSPVKCNPLAYWEFRDCMEYLSRRGLERHPLHDQGFPSIGDAHSTVPVPEDRWYEYAGERSGRFQGLQNKDGSVKTECGIHVKDEE